MADVPRVSAREAARMLAEGYQYIDVRSVPEYATGHPAGAHNIPVAEPGRAGLEPNPRFLPLMEALYPKDAKLLIGCQVGQRSLRAARMLVAAGYRDVHDVRPGMSGVKDPFGRVLEPGWVAEGLPTELTTAGGSYAERLAAAGL